MKKIEIYLTNDEHAELLTKIREFQNKIMDNQEDGVYAENERAEIMDASGSISFYIKKGLKKQLKEMEAYIENKMPKDPKITVSTEAHNLVKKEMTPDLMQPLQCETESEEATEFDFNV